MTQIQLERAIVHRLETLTRPNTPDVRAVRREFSKHIASKPAAEVVKLSLALLGRLGIFYRFLAYELVHHHAAALRSLRRREIIRFGEGIDSWGAVDMFACYISGPAWRAGQVADALIHRWARSEDRWWRRTAVVSTVPLNNKKQGGAGDPERTLPVCLLVVNDRDDMVVKAVSWALRELAKRDPRSVRGFLRIHEPALAPRVLREVGNKLRTGLKNPRGRS